MVLLKLAREGLGHIIVALDYVFSPTPVVRDTASQIALDKACSRLILYQFYACPFCIKTRRYIRKLNLKIKTLSAQTESGHEELRAGGGKVQVPCLRIRNELDSDEWLYESDEIIRYLDEHFATK